MNKKAVFTLILLLAVALSACGTQADQATAVSTEVPMEEPTLEPEFPPAPITNDEGGPVLVAGEWNYTSGYVGRHFTEPVAILIDVSRRVQADFTEWVSPDGQVMGVLTRPLAPAPTAYEVELPIEPDGRSVDLDNDGEDDAGVQIYGALIMSNLVGDSYLEQLEQADDFSSYLGDPLTGNIRLGSFLVYAPDAEQGFPAGAGADGIYFTADDPIVGLPAGYTVAILGEDGTVSFDRSRVADMPILESAASASPDFSDQGILESYHSLLDLLKERYSYTEKRGLDWEAIRAEYLPRVQEADQAGDFTAYYGALNELAISIRDAHVFLLSENFAYSTASQLALREPFSGGFGVRLAELSDGRVVVTYLDPEGPGAGAGWQVGTEILTVNGVPIDEHITTLPLFYSASNPEIIRLNQLAIALAFPEGSENSIEYLQPGASQPQEATLTASYVSAVDVPGPEVPKDEISFRQLEGGAYYIQWKAFSDELYKIAVWEKFLQQAQGSPGIIIDLRENGGGSTILMHIMASYLFTEEEPAQLHWFDQYEYDDQTGDLVLVSSTDYTLSSPKPNLTYTGPVIVLVGQKSASAGEYFPQFLQTQGRAVVVGEHGTEGAGGFLEIAPLPGDFSFAFTKSRTTFAGTEEFNLEAKGVTLDVRVPITLENELAKQAGRDVVLETGLETIQEATLRKAAEQLTEFTWGLTSIQRGDEIGNFTETVIDDPTSITITFGTENQLAIQADCNQAAGEYAIGGNTIQIELGPTTLAACPEGSQGEAFLELLPGEKEYEINQEEGTTGLALIVPFEVDVPPLFLIFEALE